MKQIEISRKMSDVILMTEKITATKGCAIPRLLCSAIDRRNKFGFSRINTHLGRFR